MIVRFSRHFLKSSERLPKDFQEKLFNMIIILSNNPYDPRLHTKTLRGKLSGYCSFRINRDWRVIFQFMTENEIKLIDIANRKDIYR